MTISYNTGSSSSPSLLKNYPENKSVPCRRVVSLILESCSLSLSLHLNLRDVQFVIFFLHLMRREIMAADNGRIWGPLWVARL